MNGIEAHKIYIIAGILAIVGVIVTMVVMKFDGDDQVDPATAKVNSQTMLPSIPSSKKEQEVTSKLDQIEDQQKEDRNKERLAQANGNELDLNIFDVEEDPIGLKEESTKKQVVKQYVQPKPKRKLQITKQVVVEQQQNNEKTIDPDLDFATGFTDRPTKVDILPTSITLNAVIHDQKTVTDGSRITLRTTSDVTYDGKVIPKNSFLLATVEYRTGRVFLILPRIKFDDGSYVHKSFDLYDSNDGQIGIFSQELLESEVAQDTGSDLVDDVANDVNSGVARGVIRNLGKKKIRLTEITLQRNQAVLIKSRL